MNQAVHKPNSTNLQTVFWLKHPESAVLENIGKKAQTLARLCQFGIPVPDGFCISSDAHQKALEMAENYGSGDRPSGLHPLPPEVCSQVMSAFSTLEERYGENVALAVRSSAISEDLQTASYAGLYQTVLNVKGITALLEAIQEVWASVSSLPVTSYNAQFVEKPRSQMAVIVQIMVPADLAGVLFTVDPRNGDESKMVAEIAAGLGDQVVSGRMNPGRIVFHRQTERQIEVSDPEGRLTGQNGKATPWQILIGLAKKIERLQKAPQDIEWAYHNGKFWILQSRAITTNPRKIARQVWTRANAGEILPEVVTPLTWSMFKPILSLAGYHRGKSMLTIHWNWKHPQSAWPDSPRLFAGRAYMELSSVYAGFANFPGVNAEILQKLLGFEFNLLEKNELPVKRFRWHVMDPFRALRYSMEIMGITHSVSGAANPWLKRIQPAGKPDSEDPAVIFKRIEQLKKEAAQVLALHIQCTSLAFSAFGLAHRIVKQYASLQMLRAFESGFTTQYQNISTAQQMVMIWDMAQLAASSISGRKALYELKASDAVIQGWRNSPEDERLIQLWDQFLFRFGNRSTQEFELSVPRWNDDPDFVLQMMRNVISSARPDPRVQLQQQQQDGKEMVAAINERIRKAGMPTTGWLFRRLYQTLEEFIPLRENLKYSVVSRFNSIRKEFLKLAKKFRESGLISEPDEIFFLTYLEISHLVSDPTRPKNAFQQIILQRKQEYQEYSVKKTADIVEIREGKEVGIELSPNPNQTVLTGIPCSFGIVTGPAYVSRSLESTELISPGDVLVVPAVDPGMTPIFLNVAGLITEVGGLLSHGATLAREFGIPAVVNVPGATALIRNGQRITLDGFNGTVTLLTEEEA